MGIIRNIRRRIAESRAKRHKKIKTLGKEEYLSTGREKEFQKLRAQEKKVIAKMEGAALKKASKKGLIAELTRITGSREAAENALAKIARAQAIGKAGDKKLVTSITDYINKQSRGKKVSEKMVMEIMKTGSLPAASRRMELSAKKAPERISLRKRDTIRLEEADANVLSGGIFGDKSRYLSTAEKARTEVNAIKGMLKRGESLETIEERFVDLKDQIRERPGIKGKILDEELSTIKRKIQKERGARGKIRTKTDLQNALERISDLEGAGSFNRNRKQINGAVKEIDSAMNQYPGLMDSLTKKQRKRLESIKESLEF